MKNFKHIFIFGPQRSGSTLLFNIFSNHQDIITTPNDLNILNFLKQDRPSIQNGKQKLVRWKIGYPDNIINELLTCSPAEFLRTILDTYFLYKKQLIRLHKTPKGEFDIDIYRSAFPEAEFIFIIRNPMAIMASRKHWSLSNPGYKLWKDLERENLMYLDIKKYTYFIRKHLEDIFRSIEVIDNNSKLFETLKVISYEDFVTDPIKNIINLLDLVGLKYNNQIHSQVKKLSNPYTSYKLLRKKQGIYTDSTNLWKSKLTNNEQWLIRNTMKVFFNSYKFKSNVIKNYFENYLTEIEELLCHNNRIQQVE